MHKKFDINKFLPYLREGERIDDLQIGGLGIIQNPKGFCFGVDAVLLSDFIEIKEGDECVEFGTGTGVISLLVSQKKRPSIIHALEIQEEVCDMATRSVLMNGLEYLIKVHHSSIQDAKATLQGKKFDCVFFNPPYMEAGRNIPSSSNQKYISRHEALMTVEDIFISAAQILRYTGKLYLVHRPNRLPDLLEICRQYHFEPRILRMISPNSGKDANIMLISFEKGNAVKIKKDFKVLPHLYIYDNDGNYSQEIFEIYGRVGINKNPQSQE